MLLHPVLQVLTLGNFKLRGEEMKKPKVPFGTIYRRGKKGTFYFENRKRGINPCSLKTSDPDEAMEKVYDRFGYLNYHDELKQHEHILQRYQTLC